jgi:hypothetical protein
MPPNKLGNALNVQILRQRVMWPENAIRKLTKEVRNSCSDQSILATVSTGRNASMRELFCQLGERGSHQHDRIGVLPLPPVSLFRR